MPTSTANTIIVQQQCADDDKIIDENNQHSTNNDDDDDGEEEEISSTNDDQDNNIQQQDSNTAIMNDDQILSTATTPTTWKIMMPSWDTIENLTWSEQYEEERAYEDLCYVTFSSEVIIYIFHNAYTYIYFFLSFDFDAKRNQKNCSSAFKRVCGCINVFLFDCCCVCCFFFLAVVLAHIIFC